MYLYDNTTDGNVTLTFPESYSSTSSFSISRCLHTQTSAQSTTDRCHGVSSWTKSTLTCVFSNLNYGSWFILVGY